MALYVILCTTYTMYTGDEESQGVWTYIVFLWQGNSMLPKCCCHQSIMAKTPDMTPHPVRLYWHLANQSGFLALASQCYASSVNLKAENPTIKSSKQPVLSADVNKSANIKGTSSGMGTECGE